METITMAALRVGSNIFTGRSHIQCAVEAERALPRYVLDQEICEDGFLTSTGRFVSPTLAQRIAADAGQVKDVAGELHSETLFPGHQFTRTTPCLGCK